MMINSQKGDQNSSSGPLPLLAPALTTRVPFCRTLGWRNECRTAPDGRRPLDQAHGLEPLARL